MADEEDIVVTIDEQPDLDQAAAKDDKGAAASEKPASAVTDLSDQYKELQTREENARKAEEAARRRAEASERAAQEAMREAEAAKAAARHSNLDTINTALASVASEVEAAKRDIRLAGEAGDYEALADAQERLANAKALSIRYDEAKADLETTKAQLQRQSRQPDRQADPVEAFIAGRTEPSQKWLRAHTDYITDQRKLNKLNAAHHDAMAEGLSPDTDDYFNHVETFLGLKQAAAEPKPQTNGAKRPAARVVAPTTTGSGSAPSGNANEVRLTSGEARAATDGTHVWNYDDPSGKGRFKKGDPIGVQEMARRKLALQKQGAYDRTYETQ